MGMSGMEAAVHGRAGGRCRGVFQRGTASWKAISGQREEKKQCAHRDGTRLGLREALQRPAQGIDVIEPPDPRVTLPARKAIQPHQIPQTLRDLPSKPRGGHPASSVDLELARSVLAVGTLDLGHPGLQGVDQKAVQRCGPGGIAACDAVRDCVGRAHADDVCTGAEGKLDVEDEDLAAEDEGAAAGALGFGEGFHADGGAPLADVGDAPVGDLCAVEGDVFAVGGAGAGGSEGLADVLASLAAGTWVSEPGEN